MFRRSLTGLVAVLTFALAGAAAAQTPRDPGAQQNVKESQQYEQLLHSNPGFRAQRLQKECGPISDPQLHEQCVASFNADNPGGEAAPAGRRSSRRPVPHE